MLLSREEALRLLVYDNPWWAGQMSGLSDVQPSFAASRLAAGLDSDDLRPQLLAGPCRSGKTGMLLHGVQARLDAGDAPQTILYIPAADPVFAAFGPSALLDLCVKGHGLSADTRMTVLVDDAHRLDGWREALAELAACRPGLRVAAAASVLPGSRGGLTESCGSCNEFRAVPAPHPTFADWLRGRGLETKLVGQREGEAGPVLFAPNLPALNREFLAYANHGAPASLMGSHGNLGAHGGGTGNVFGSRRALREAFEAVFRTDLPGLFGVTDVRLLTRLFGAVAWRTGELTSFSALGRDCDCTGETARRYFEYLEDAFLVSRVARVDEEGRDVRGAPFKCYVAAPWMRAALFSPVDADNKMIGRLAETALFAQWHAAGYAPNLRHARNRKGGVDMVGLSETTGRPGWACAVRYADGEAEGPGATGLDGLAVFARRAGVGGAVSAATFDAMGAAEVLGVTVSAVPCALLSYAVACGLGRGA